MSCAVCGMTRSMHLNLNPDKPFKLHSMPIEDKRIQQWIDIFPQTTLKPNSKVCTYHFIDIDYIDNEFGFRLKKNAIPRSSMEVFQYQQLSSIQSVPNSSDKRQARTSEKVVVDVMPKTPMKFETIAANVCRMCLATDFLGEISIHSPLEGQTVAEMMTFVSGIETPTTSDNLPQVICSMCIASLLSACNTKKLCIESDASLKARLAEDFSSIIDEIKDEPPEEVEMVECLDTSDEQDLDSKIEYLEDEDINPADLMNPPQDNPKISFKCYICNMHFGYERKRADHLKTNHFDHDLICGDCSYEGSTPQAFNNHLELHMRPELITNFDDTYNPSDKVTQLQLKTSSSKIVFTQKCHVCHETFSLKAQKIEHLNTVHADLNLNCELCPKKCKTLMGMDEHLRVHQNPELLAHMCHMCSKFFIRPWELRAHIKYDHRIAKAFMYCDMCGFKAVTMSKLKAHIENVHLRLRKFVCDECPREFNSKMSLDLHKTSIHGMVTNIQCEACLRYFPMMSVLRMHLKSCSGVPNKPIRVINKVDVNIYREKISEDTFKCKMCGKIYSGPRCKDRISIHYSNVHKYACTRCSSYFKNQSLLDQHMAKAH